jgi:2'-5' RNA ligase
VAAQSIERARNVRLFLALWPTPQVRSGLLAWRDAFAWPASATVVAPERLHMTLHFIGAVPAERVDAVQAGLAIEPAAFELRFGRAEVWPRGIAVLRPLAEPPALHDLHQRLGEALRALDLPTEARPFRPHVTFARRADDTGPAALARAQPCAGRVAARPQRRLCRAATLWLGSDHRVPSGR